MITAVRARTAGEISRKNVARDRKNHCQLAAVGADLTRLAGGSSRVVQSADEGR